MRFVAGLVALMLLGSVCGLALASDMDPESLPHCWSVGSDYQADAAALMEFGARFGVELVSLSNYKVDTDGAAALQINIVTCRDASDAQKVFDYFMSAQHAYGDKYVRSGNRVYEFLSDDHRVRAAAAHYLGVGAPRARTYRVKVEVAPLDRGDESRWNEMFNAVLAHAGNPGDEEAVLRAREVGTAFTWKNELLLRMARPQWGAPAYEFSPAPVARATAGDILTVSFENLARVVDVPRVTVEAVVPVMAFADYRPAGAVDGPNLTRETEPWPNRHQEVNKTFLHPDWRKDASAMEWLEFIHCYLRDHMEYRGETGSRYGTVQALQQGYGRCWDFSDAFISMCRRVGIPARQVFGWIYGGAGHVWAEAYIEERGWIAVDPTASWLGVTEDYVPLFYSESGHAPFLYTSIPEITPAE